MSWMSRTVLSSIGVCLAVASLAACGGSSSGATGPRVVAQVGSYAITKATLNQWMTEKIGEDFFDVATHQVPQRLVAEPANYPACVAALKAIAPIPGEGKPQPQPTAAQLMNKCKELYQAIKTQALTYLVSAYWTINFYAEHAINATEAEVQQAFKKIQAELYPKAGELQQLFTTRRRSLSQELFIVKQDVLQQKVLNKLLRGGKRVIATFQQEAKNAEDTAVCQPGYVVEHCKGYKAPKTTYAAADAVSPGVLLEEVARWRPETSHGFTGVPVL